MQRWLKSLRRNNKAATRKFNRVHVRTNKNDEHIVTTHDDKTTLGGPYPDKETAEQFALQYVNKYEQYHYGD